MISGIDLFIVVFFIVGVFVVGVYFKKFIHTSEDYFLAGRRLGWWVIGMSIIGTNIGSYDYVGGAGAAYDVGIAQANFEWIGAIPAMVISALLFVPYYWRAGAYTVPEYLGKRYSQPVRVIEALLWGSFLVCCLAIFFWASGVMINTYVDWPIWFGILLTAVIVGIYTVTGGLTAGAMTDVIQLAIMLVGGFAMAVIGFHEVGGWSGGLERLGLQDRARAPGPLPAVPASQPRDLSVAGDDTRAGTCFIPRLVVLSSGDHSKDTGGTLRVGRKGRDAQRGLSEDACAVAVRPAGPVCPGARRRAAGRQGPGSALGDQEHAAGRTGRPGVRGVSRRYFLERRFHA
jgi:hypothetical protein